jgi:putative flippase GtrA
MPAQPANAIALLATAVANTAANRRFTFAVRGADNAVRHQVQGLVVFAVALALTSGSLFVLHRLEPAAPRREELAVLASSTALAIVLRYLLLRLWVFRRLPVEADQTLMSSGSRPPRGSRPGA